MSYEDEDKGEMSHVPGYGSASKVTNLALAKQ